jgi:hypothetical protein
MGQSFQALEQHFLQISVDLLSRMAEIQKLRVAIQSAEASKRRNALRVHRSRPDPKPIAPSGQGQLRA